jgi:hypothetical protein
MRQFFNASTLQRVKRQSETRKSLDKDLLFGSENRSHVNASFERRETAWNLFYLNFLLEIF